MVKQKNNKTEKLKTGYGAAPAPSFLSTKKSRQKLDIGGNMCKFYTDMKKILSWMHWWLVTVSFFALIGLETTAVYLLFKHLNII